MAARMFERLLTLTLPPPPTTSKFYTPLLISGLIGLGLAIAWLPPTALLLMLGGSIFAGVLLQKPLLALYVLIPLIPFSALLSVPLAGFNIGLMELVLAGGLLAWLLQLLVRSPGQPTRSITLTRPPAYLGLPLLLFIGGLTLSWLTTLSIGASLVETIKWVEVLALYLLIVHLLPLRDLKWVTATLLLAGMAQAALGLYQFIFKVGPEGFLLFGGRFLRAYGTFAQPNPYAGYLGLVLPLALAVALWAFKFLLPAPPEGGEATKIPPSGGLGGLKLATQLKILILLGLSLPLGLLLAGLFASQSRGGWLAFGVAALATVIVYSRRPGLLLTALFTAGATIALVGAFDWNFGQAGGSSTALNAVTQRFIDAANIISLTDIASLEVTDANFATVERLAHWQAAREMWRDHPWLGVGIGNYAVVYPAYAIGRWLDPLGHAHNYLLNIGAEAGLVGILAYTIFWIWTFGVLWRTVRHSHGFHRAVAAGSFGILVHLHTHNLFDNLYVQGMYLHIAIVLAITSVIYYQTHPKSSI